MEKIGRTDWVIEKNNIINFCFHQIEDRLSSYFHTIWIMDYDFDFILFKSDGTWSMRLDSKINFKNKTLFVQKSVPCEKSPENLDFIYSI